MLEEQDCCQPWLVLQSHGLGACTEVAAVRHVDAFGRTALLKPVRVGRLSHALRHCSRPAQVRRPTSKHEIPHRYPGADLLEGWAVWLRTPRDVLQLELLEFATCKSQICFLLASVRAKALSSGSGITYKPKLSRVRITKWHLERQMQAPDLDFRIRSWLLNPCSTRRGTLRQALFNYKTACRPVFWPARGPANDYPTAHKAQ